MIEILKELSNINFFNFLIIVFLIISAAVSSATLIGKFSEIIGKPVKWIKKKNEDHELLIKTTQSLNELQKKQEEDVKQSIQHDERIKKDLQTVSEKVDNIVVILDNMERKNNTTEMKKLKEKLVAYYNKYKDIGEWSYVEKEVFWDLFEDYEARGGDGFIHSTVEPVMRGLKVLD